MTWCEHGGGPMTIGVDDEHGICHCARPAPSSPGSIRIEFDEWEIRYLDIPAPPPGALVAHR